MTSSAGRVLVSGGVGRSRRRHRAGCTGAPCQDPRTALPDLRKQLRRSPGHGHVLGLLRRRVAGYGPSYPAAMGACVGQLRAGRVRGGGRGVGSPGLPRAVRRRTARPRSVDRGGRRSWCRGWVRPSLRPASLIATTVWLRLCASIPRTTMQLSAVYKAGGGDRTGRRAHLSGVGATLL